MKKVFIEIVKLGDDSGAIVQYAYSVKQAQMLIDKNIMPKLKPGYYYNIIKQSK